MTVRSIVILANSYKNGQRCIAGKEVIRAENGKYNLTNNWYRPVTTNAQTHGAIPTNICWDRHSSRHFATLDIVEIDFSAHVPEPGQPENWTFNPSKLWTKVGYFESSVAVSLLDDPADLWIDPDSAKISMVSEAYTNSGNVQQSLLLIQPEALRLHLSNEHNPWDDRYERKMKASFTFKNTEYTGIRVTDPVIMQRFSNEYPNEGEPTKIISLRAGDSYSLCISLAPPFASNGNTQSKLLAAVIPQALALKG